MYFRLEVVHYLANSEVTHNHRQSLQHFSLYMLLLPHHSSAAQRRPTNKPLCEQMSHDMFVCCAESSRQVLQSFVLILLWFYQTLIISLGNMWPQLGLHLRHQRSRLFCVVASIWGIWLHWTLFLQAAKGYCRLTQCVWETDRNWQSTSCRHFYFVASIWVTWTNLTHTDV